ncbi:MAG: fold metallo-hydrolase [Chloroflexi bacterium]|jgi:L-ascorbate metabolism protein UlaG (beta-lactamase superfamily)|nr:fold metallo-hydrolase [Chloroflexota bacterium]
MRITKYIHSCLLLEEAGHKLLFDPGKFSFIEGRVKPELFGDVNAIAISHEHPDHVDVDALKQIVGQSRATVIANSQVAARLQTEGIAVQSLETGPQEVGGFTIQAIPAQHEPILAGELPQNTAYLVNGRILNPGDSFQPSLLAYAGVELLILPVMAPWLTELAVYEFARKIQPQQVIPVHDGYSKDFFLKLRYTNYDSYLSKLNIKFHPLMEPGASIMV